MNVSWLKPPSERMFLALIACVVLVYGAIAAVVRPAMYSDSGFGFVVWDSMRRDAAFNYLTSPDPANIARDASYFMTTWSPGQYFFPGLLEWLGLDLGLAIVAIVTVFSLMGLAGWFTLYRAFGFPAVTAMIAVAILACSRHFTLPYGIYNGGETLMFGLVPWFALGVWRLRDCRWRALPFFLMGGLVLIFAKLIGLMLAASLLGAAALSADRAWLKRETIAKIVVTGASVGLMGAIFYFAWFSRGWTAVASAGPTDWSKLVPFAALAVSATWGSAFALGDLSDFVFRHPSRPILTSETAYYLAAAPIALATFWFVWRRLRAQHGEYLRFTALAALAFGTVMVAIWVRGSGVQIEERYFRPLSMLLLPGIVHAFVTAPQRPVRILFVLFAAGAGLYGVASYASHARADLHHAMSERGFRQHIATAGALAFLHSIDQPAPDGTRPVIFVPSPEIALEVRQGRVIATLADFEEPELLKSRIWHGRVSALYVLIQNRLVANGKADIILRSFVDTPIGSWKQLAIDDEFVAYSALK